MGPHAWQYVPTDFIGQSYFILLNTYNDNGPYNWSTEVVFDGGSDIVSMTASPAASCR
ncbi:MAG: hypothetical protein R2844_03500 [Caldilineales bacterium]